MLARVRLSARTVVIAMALLLSLCIAFISRSMQQAKAAATSFAPISTVNAASFMGPLAPGTIAAAFGTGLATRTEAAQSQPLPTQIAGTSVKIVDSKNVTHQAQLFFVSSGQINYMIPEQAATGPAQVQVTSGDGTVTTGSMMLENSSPAIFTATASGQGIAAALTTVDGKSFQNIANPDGSARAVSPSTTQNQNVLLLFGTGLRRASNVRVRFGSLEVTPSFAGAQGGFAGLDQINVTIPANISLGMVNISVIADGRTSNISQIFMQPPLQLPFVSLSVNDVQTILAQAVAKAQQLGVNVTAAVTDREGNILGVFRMNGAPATTRIGAFELNTRQQLKPVDPDGLQNVDVPASLAAISKAGTAAFFSTMGSGISTRTASFIVQEHFPPQASGTMPGPLFGVQFSQLPCSDVRNPRLPLGLSADPGGVPIYIGGKAAGGLGIEFDGLYSADINTRDNDIPFEEVIAVAGVRGYECPAALRIDTIALDGMRLPFVNSPQTGNSTPPFASLPGSVDPRFPIRATPPSRYTPLTLGGVNGRVVSGRFFPFKDSTSTAAVKLTADDVTRILTQAAQGADRGRSQIRNPRGLPIEINLSVVDTNGVVLGLFSTDDAPEFGFDVCVQKARTANLFSLPTAAAQLRAAEGGRNAKFVDASIADGVLLDGKFAFSSRGMGFLARPFFPDGIDGTVNGPYSKPIGVWSPFNVGLQLTLVQSALVQVLNAVNNPATDVVAALSGVNPVVPCVPDIPAVANGLMIFAGGVPIYKNGVLVGAIGGSGDGIEPDEVAVMSGAFGFEPPAAIRCDQLTPRGVRLPFVKYTRNPNIP